MEKHMTMNDDAILNGLTAEPLPKRSLENISLIREDRMGEVSDGYHTFNELYKHRCLLYIALLKCHWRMCLGSSEIPCDSMTRFVRFRHYKGWFCLGLIDENIGQISYHIPDEYWDACSFAEEKQWEFDGHSTDDVLERLEKLIKTI